MIVRKGRNAPYRPRQSVTRMKGTDEAAEARIRNRSGASTAGETAARLRKRITLPKVKGYWE